MLPAPGAASPCSYTLYAIPSGGGAALSISSSTSMTLLLQPLRPGATYTLYALAQVCRWEESACCHALGSLRHPSSTHAPPLAHPRPRQSAVGYSPSSAPYPIVVPAVPGAVAAKLTSAVPAGSGTITAAGMTPSQGGPCEWGSGGSFFHQQVRSCLVHPGWLPASSCRPPTKLAPTTAALFAALAPPLIRHRLSGHIHVHRRQWQRVQLHCSADALARTSWHCCYLHHHQPHPR